MGLVNKYKPHLCYFLNGPWDNHLIECAFYPGDRYKVHLLKFNQPSKIKNQKFYTTYFYRKIFIISRLVVYELEKGEDVWSDS